MFAARQRPLLVLEDRLLALRPSLNTPVVATAEIPTGPARAAIFVYAEGGTRRFAVAVHAVQGAAAVVYELSPDFAADDADGWTVALDATLSFGESMGFVFDDELVTDRRPDTLRRAVGKLRELLAPGASVENSQPPRETAMEIGSADDLAEILLDEELEGLALEPAAPPTDLTPPLVAPASTPEGVTSPPSAFAPGVALSKFRSAPPQGAPSAPAPESPSASAQGPRGPATLGRVKPRKVRADGEPASGREPLLRLLADF
jgi:hypothetical protein